IMEATGLTRVRVLQLGGELAKKGIVKQVQKGGEVAYEMIPFFQAHKARILRLAKDKRAIEAWPTKRKVAVQLKLPSSISLPTMGADVARITIDDIDTFDLVRTVCAGEPLPASLSEEHFKRGIQKIIGEAGEFKDWGGENSDLFSSRLQIDGKR